MYVEHKQNKFPAYKHAINIYLYLLIYYVTYFKDTLQFKNYFNLKISWKKIM